MSSFQELADRWQVEADTLRRNCCEPQATIIERHIAELKAAIRADDDAPLDLSTAAKESGYSADRLRHMLADGVVPNAGRKGAPRVRRKDLPRKRSKQSSFDPAAAAQRALGAK